ncbi:hypothetical protein [Bacillus horti]|uniref:Uncharacterized protein n=1 Tax=Caldalkalibacillus horti TaxID=77523 RepID=A0ABT9W4P6_9BACI|nr:hypothetical protein [Bacillus horti]MDQ0168205.1 hypothetical protein [Bacillus horti]
MSDQVFTQEQVDDLLQQERTKWNDEVLNPLVTERDSLLQFKPKDLTDEEKAIQIKQQELFKKEVSLELKSAGLEKFADFFVVESVDDLKGKMSAFQSLLGEMKIDNSYKPNDHKHTDPYSKFEKDGNTVGMIGSKLSKIFK